MNSSPSIVGERLAEERQRSLRAAEGPRPTQAVAESLSALNALHAMGMWPGPLDPISEERVQDVRRRWVRVQRRAKYQAAAIEIDVALMKAIETSIARFHADIRRLALARSGGGR